MPIDVDSEASAYAVLEQLRWGGPPRTCPRCAAHDRCYFLKPADGTSRATRTGARSSRRVWKCGACRGQFSVLTGTVLEGSRVGVLSWLRFVADIVDGSTPTDTVARARRCGITVRTAQRMSRVLSRSADVEPALRPRLSGLDG